MPVVDAKAQLRHEGGVAAALDSALWGCSCCGTGTQVIIKGPSGKLLATTNLTKDASATAALNLPSALGGSLGQMGIYTFTTTIPAGNGPYTVDVVGVSSLVVSGSQLAHLHLSCG